MRIDVIIGAMMIAAAIVAAALILRPGRYQLHRPNGNHNYNIIFDAHTGSVKYKQ